MEFSGNYAWLPKRLAKRLYGAPSILRRLARETRGTEIAEAAAVLPLLFMFILGIFWFGQAFSMFGTITRAAQDGARAAAAPYCTTCSSGTTPAQNAFNAVQSAMNIAKLNPTLARYPSPQPPLSSCSGAGTVSCDGTSSNVCVQNQILLSNNLGGATSVCGVSVTFQYPFQFTLPFTSLNNRQIWLNASARVRQETQ